MKRLLTSIMLIAGLMVTGNILAQSQGQSTPADPNAPVMKFEKDTIDYGTIPHFSDGTREFHFTNVGKEPLIIKEAKGSCGCTVPTAPTEPIQPGQSAVIKVHYATQRVGMFIKNVTLTTNANPPSKVLTIHGNVLPEPATEPTATTVPAQQAPPTGGH